MPVVGDGSRGRCVNKLADPWTPTAAASPKDGKQVFLLSCRLWLWANPSGTISLRWNSFEKGQDCHMFSLYDDGWAERAAPVDCIFKINTCGFRCYFWIWKMFILNISTFYPWELTLHTLLLFLSVAFQKKTEPGSYTQPNKLIAWQKGNHTK